MRDTVAALHPYVSTRTAAAAMAILFLLGVTAPTRAATGAPTDLGTLGGTSSAANGVNSSGVVVGTSATALSDSHAFRWTQADGMLDLGVPPGDVTSNALAVNDAGTVVGFGSDGNSIHAVMWMPATASVVTLGDLGGNFSVARAINNNGVVVGESRVAGGASHAFLWTQATGMTDLGTLPGGSVSLAFGINSNGVVVGTSSIAGGGLHAFMWTQAGGMVDLGTLPGVSTSQAIGVNDDGVIVGGPVGSPFTLAPGFVWTQTAGMVSLGTLGGPGSSGRSINANGLVVGFSDTTNDPAAPNAHIHAFAWTQSGGMVDLGTLGGSTSLANGVNRSGVVVGRSAIPGDAVSHATLWDLGSNTPAGVNVSITQVVTLPNGGTTSVSLTFDNVQSAGTTSITTSSTGFPPPSGFKLTDPPVYYQITTTAQLTGNVRVCLNWVEGQIVNESNVTMFHFEGGIWIDITDPSSRDPVNNTVCGNSAGLSPFTLFETKYPFTGFFQPVDNAPVFNKAKAGSAVPVKFSLGGDRGLDIFAAGYPRAVLIQCETGSPLNDIEQTATAGGSTLLYDSTTGQYVYVWKTERAWAGSCRQLQVRLNDGEVYTAKFNLTR